MITRLILAFSIASVLAVLAHAAEYEISISAEKSLTNVPISVPLDLPQSLIDAKHVQITHGDVQLLGQITAASLLSRDPGKHELHVILPVLESGQHEVTVEISPTDTDANPFHWQDTDGKHALLSRGDRPVLDYMYEALDDSSEQRRMETYKVYHHVYDPTGKRPVTKGPGGLFPHHRGLFYGFNRISYGDGGKKKADVWHCKNGASQAHKGIVQSAAGAILGRHRVAIDWKGEDDKVFATELREMTVYNVDGGNLIEFASRLETAGGKVRLDGDPQHAGFQFRASQQVPDHTKHLTYYVRPDGKGEPGKFRNWSQKTKGDNGHVNLPWNALCFVIDDQRFTCCYLDRPENPKEARFSERDYGRFGSYFEYDLDEQHPLELNYRIWLQEGEMTVDQIKKHSDAFASQPKTAVKTLSLN